MKKLLIPLVTLLVLSFILAGCGGTTTTPVPTTPATKPPVTTSAPVTTPAPVATTAQPKPTSPPSTAAAPSTTTAAAPSSSPSVTPQSGGTLLLWVTGDPVSLYPPTMTGQTDGQTAGFALETLFRFDQQYNLVPLLATDYKTDATAKTITISLRKGVKFTDGSDFNATVCKWNLDQYRTSAKGELKKVASVDIVDDYTVRLNLSAFDNTIILNLSSGADAGRMISQKSFDANGGKDWAAKNPVGTGPFTLASWTKSVGLTWKRNDNYWGGKPYLDGIQQKEYADQTVALMDFKAGNLHTLRPDPRDAKTLQATGLYKVVTPPEGQVPALAGYAADPTSPFNKVAVRQAMSYAIDVKTMNDSFGLGYWQVMNQWAVPGTPGYNPNVVGYPYNPQKAKDLLTAAGYPQGFKTTFSWWNLSQSYTDEATAIQNYLAAVGITVTLNPLQRPAFSDAASNGKGWSGILREQGYSSPDPLIKFANTVASQEFVGIALPQEVIDAFNAAIAAPDAASKQKLTWQFMSLTTDKYCMATYLYVQQSPMVKSKNVHDDLNNEVPFNYVSPMAWLSK